MIHPDAPARKAGSVLSFVSEVDEDEFTEDRLGDGSFQRAGPAHVEMMGFLGAGNNPMVGMTVAVAVAVQEAMNK